ncbi:Putative protein in type-1 retrotransposable element R1DM [Araneus ventricosus]|uniref:Retrovirus-related Pol polyprotein from type-1 retrotransposable element R1 n=1 Tax=Araneus ventricosus TaxID=182803 RepID=A0A4Y2H4T0_ARAVE|nr:Putative protein in type-1 retrotransposable element R1DM [Araneus ventricosus]
MGKPKKKQQINDADNSTSHPSRERSNSTSSEISTTSSVVSIDMYNYEDASFSELIVELKSIINGGTSTTTDQGGSKFRASLKMDLSHRANKLIDAIEFKYHLPAAKQKVKIMKDFSCSTSWESKEQGIQTIQTPSTQQPVLPTTEVMVEVQTPTYATSLKKGKEIIHKRPNQPTILLYHKELYDDGNQKMEKKGLEHLLREELSCNEVNLSNIKPVRNNGIAITCKKEGDAQAILDKIANTESLNKLITARRPKKRHPSIIIYGISDQTTNEELQDALRHRTGIENDIKLRFKLRGRTEGTSHWVFETPSDKFQKNSMIKKLPINWSMHNVRECFHIKKCQRCQAYGHLVNNFKNIKPFCGFCGNRHQTSQCRATVACCINCNDENRRKGTKTSSDQLGKNKRCLKQLTKCGCKISIILCLYKRTLCTQGRDSGYPSGLKCIFFSKKKAAILSPSNINNPIIMDKKTNAIAIKVHTDNFPITIISAYSSPQENIERTLEELQSILVAIKKENFIICADLNGHHSFWGYSNEDPRGQKILDFVLANNLFISNTSDAPPTHLNYNGSKGWSDLSICSHQLINKISTWEVLEDTTNSDHQYIQIKLNTNITSFKLKRYKTLHGNFQKFTESFRTRVPKLEEKISLCSTPEVLNSIAQTLQQEIISACNYSFKIRQHKLISNTTWWTANLESEKKRLIALRRRAQRSGADEQQARFRFFKAERTKYMGKIRSSKTNGWKNVCSSAKNPYGKHYKSAFRKVVLPTQLSVLQGNSPQGVGKDPKEPSSYRPIALLPTIGKVLEKLLTQRLTFFLENGNKLNEHQHGFREGKSVDTALASFMEEIQKGRSQGNHVLAISLDIKGAFDNILHHAIINNLKKAEVPSNLQNIFENILKNRKVLLNTQEGLVSRDQRKGCPQGSCSGPALWNLVVNSLLNIHWSPNVHMQAFADYLVLITKSSTKEGLKVLTNDAMTQIVNWAESNLLTISHEKSNFLMYSKLVAAPPVLWKNHRIKRLHAIKFLGIDIDDKLNWNSYIRYLSQKTQILNQNFLKIACPSWGISRSHRLLLYKTVIERVFAHGSSIWCINPTAKISRKLDSIQRSFLLSISGAYRTTSTAVLQVLLGLPPLALKLQQEAVITNLIRLRKPELTLQLLPDNYEQPLSRRTSHPSLYLLKDQISLSDGGLSPPSEAIYTDGSKTEKGVGAAYCRIAQNRIIESWFVKLPSQATVFQAELLALRKAVELAKTMVNQTPIKIFTDNRAAIQASSNPKSKNHMARQIFLSLLSSPNIKLNWIKAHAVYFGNESADLQAKSAADSETTNIHQIKFSKAFLKTHLKKFLTQEWQRTWEDATTGRPIHNIIPKVSFDPACWIREEILFFTQHGPFSSYFNRFKIFPSPNCSCGQVGTPLHYATECILTSSWHIKKPAENLQKIWFLRVAANKNSRLLIRKIVQHINNNRALFRPD